MKKKVLTICIATIMIFSNINVSAASLTAKQVEAESSAIQETRVVNNNNSNKNTTNEEEANKKTNVGTIGIILFTFVGISLMAGTVAAMKRSREEC